MLPINKIKILYIIPTLDLGGAERFMVDLILNLDREKYEPTLILFKRAFFSLLFTSLYFVNSSIVSIFSLRQA